MPIASVAIARDEIVRDTFKAAWDLQAPPIPQVIYEDNEDDTPANGTDPWVFVKVRHNPGAGGQVTFGIVGERRFRAFGIVTVDIHTKSGDGLVTSDLLTQVAIDAFRGSDSGGPDRVTYRNVRSNEIGQDGDWFLVIVSAEFEYDIIK